MKNLKTNPLFQKGVWIKEQQGNLTIGSLDKNNTDVMVISDDLSGKLFEFENDIMDALYGEDRKPFVPGVINIEKLFFKLKKQFKSVDLRITFTGSKEYVFKGDFSNLYSILKKIILSSIPDKKTNEMNPSIIYINASMLQNHLCIIYRDSNSISKPSKLKKEIQFIKSDLNGEISYKVISGGKSYYDIMIPSKS